MVICFFAARAILVPRPAAGELSRADRLALGRTWIGFAFAAAVSLPYRSLGDTADNALGTFNLSVAVALTACTVLTGASYLVTERESKEIFRLELRAASARVGKFIGTLFLAWGVAALLDSGAMSHDRALLLLMALGGLVGVYGAGCWYISRFWFGLGRVDPLLPPLVSIVTVCIMTAIELHDEGPDPLPTRLWLLISFAAVISTFWVCFVELCDAYLPPDPGHPLARNTGSGQWPVVVATTVAIIALAAAVIFIRSGTAERTLCTGPTPLVKCTNSTAAPRG